MQKNIFIWLLHIIFWALYFGAYVLIFQLDKKNINELYDPQHIILFLTNIAAFYFNYFYLFPKFITEVKNYKLFIVFFCLTILFVSVFKTAIFYLFSRGIHINDASLPQNYSHYIIVFFISFLLSGLVMSVSLIFMMTIDFFTKKKSQEIMNAQQNFIETQYLKAKLNPAFLVQSLDQMHLKARESLDDTAEELLMLSSIMRYMIYNSNVPLIELEKELECLDTYIKLHKSLNMDEFYVDIKYDTNLNVEIPPLLLFSLLENAVKYGITSELQNPVNINVDADKNILSFEFKQKKTNLDTNGFDDAINNIERRLKLLHTEDYILKKKNTLNHFSCEIPLNVSDKIRDSNRS